jgi:hypothetical protein
MVLWYQNNGNLDTTRYNRYSATDKSWGTAAEIEVDAGHAYRQQVAFDARDNALAVWKQADVTINSAVFSIRTILYDATSNRWGVSEKIETDAGQVEHPQLSIDGLGNAWAIWQQDDSTETGTQNSIMVNQLN